MDYQLHTLPNGIRVIHQPNTSSISHVCLILNAGSRDEPADQTGLAHFIEHLLFKRTQKRSTNQILNRLEVVGADLNAYTTKEYTCLHASFLNQYLERTLDLFEDLAFHSVFPEQELLKEKQIVLDEIASYQDQPEEAIQDDFEDILFAGHPLGRNILGTTTSVQQFTRPDILRFMDANYNPQQIVIGISGNYSPEKIRRITEKLFSDHPAKTFKSNRKKPDQVIKGQVTELYKPINQAHCMIGNVAYAGNHTYKTGLLLLNNLLGGMGMSSRLNMEIREKLGIAYSIESNYTPFTDTGIFSIYFGTEAEKTDHARRVIFRELKKLCSNRLGTVQLHQAKQKFMGQIALGEENRMGLIISLSKSMLDFGKAETLAGIFAKINAVTASQLLEIANHIFDPARMVTLLFKPLPEEIISV